VRDLASVLSGSFRASTDFETDATVRRPGYSYSGLVGNFAKSGRHELALTVHPLGRPAIWILAEEPGCVS
jgi:hypothetical protein